MKSSALFISLAVILVTTNTSTAVASEEPPRLGCVNSARGTCALPIYRLYGSDVASFRSVTIVTVGFVRKVGEDYLLFPTEQAANYALSEEAFQLIPNNQATADELSEDDMMLVQITGKVRPSANAYWATIVLSNSPQVVPLHVGDNYTPAPPAPKTLRHGN